MLRRQLFGALDRIALDERTASVAAEADVKRAADAAADATAGTGRVRLAQTETRLRPETGRFAGRRPGHGPPRSVLPEPASNPVPADRRRHLVQGVHLRTGRQDPGKVAQPDHCHHLISTFFKNM